MDSLWEGVWQVKLRNKKTGVLVWASEFNLASLSEIIVHFDDDSADSDYPSNYDVQLADGQWKSLEQAFNDKDVLPDNKWEYFGLAETDEQRKRGYL